MEGLKQDMMKGDTTMRKLFECADRYAANSRWQDFALLKICVFSMGLLVGMTVSADRKKAPALLALLAFVATYIPLLLGFLPYLTDMIPSGRSQRRINKVILPE